MPVTESGLPRNRFVLLVLIHVGFVFIGIVTTLLGVILPAVSGRIGLNDAQSGALFIFQYAGSLLGTLVSGFVWRKFGFLNALAVGSAIMSAGVFGLGWLNWRGIVLCIFLNGIAIGLTIPTMNLLVSALNPNRQASALNILNFAWSLGALLSPTFFGLLGTPQDIRLPIDFLSASVLLAALCFLSFSAARIVFDESPASSSPRDAARIWRTPFAVLCVVLLFFYVGVESSLGGWITAYALRFGAAGATGWTSTVFAFWASFLLGRLLAPLALRRIESPVYILFCLALAAVGMLLLLTAQIIFLSVGAVFAGFGLAPVFPTVLAEFTRRFGAEGAGKANWLFIGSTCGGAFLTWSVGFLSNTFGSLRIGFFALFFCCLLMIAVQARLYGEIKKARKLLFFSSTA